jgi:hypothetical protein
MFLAPTFLEQGDRNKDGKLSEAEFHGLAEKWFADWDKEKAGKLNADQLRTGLNSTLHRRPVSSLRAQAVEAVEWA